MSLLGCSFLRLGGFDSTPPQPGPAPGRALDRTVLPIAEPMLASITELDARKAKAPPRFEVKARQEHPTW
jgi:arylsulfatase